METSTVNSFHESIGSIEIVTLLDGKKSKFESIFDGLPIVIDFWHTKCTKCPAALEKLNDLSEKYGLV